MMDYNWIKDNLREVEVRNCKMYIELTEDVYRVLRRYMGKNKEAIRNRLLDSVGLEDSARYWEELE